MPGKLIMMQNTTGSDVQAISSTYLHSPSCLPTKLKPLRQPRMKWTGGGS
ncbi:MAG TPA: hypothetical protein VNZ86_09075 [Bacteroidia bacterium]|nr:hypothetical protein [Bacteroidia bacterium]